MSTATPPPGEVEGGAPARERRFYLEQFTGRALVVAARDGTEAGVVAACVADLVAQGVRVVQLGLADGADAAPWRPDDEGTVAVWRGLRDGGHVALALPSGTDVLAAGVDLAVRLRAFKLVLLASDQPRPSGAARPESFLSLDATEVAGEGHRALAARALAGGVATVNLCHPADVAEELLTYAGAGTCFTMGAYTRVERLGIDDFPQVAELIERGVEEGYLKARDPDAVARLVVNGYGARVGDHHLAGFAALLTEPYADAALGEVCALTTISRFAGGGVGAQLVDRMLRAAAAAGLDGVFACTTSDQAAGFFRRLGFVEVPQGEVPAAKWAGYDPVRRPAVRAFLHHLALVGA